MMHFAGKRWALPKMVTSSQGRTDLDTPYWPVNRAVGDTDLLSLLRHLRTDNEELSRCFLGVLAQHAPSSFNGLVYVTKAPLPSTDGPNSNSVTTSTGEFLDHFWAGRLANNKTMVQQNTTFSRTVLHCTDQCQQGNAKVGPHERWRLTIYRGDSSPLSLYRVMWDPVLEPEPLSGDGLVGDPSAGKSSAADMMTGGVMAPGAVIAPRRKNKLLAHELQPLQPVVSTGEVDVGASGTLFPKELLEMLMQMEARITGRLDDLHHRVGALERHVKSTNVGK
jgi:hypothetical protein